MKMSDILIVIPNKEAYHDSYRWSHGLLGPFTEHGYAVDIVALDREPIPSKRYKVALGIEMFIDAKLLPAERTTCWFPPPNSSQGIEAWFDLGFDDYAHPSDKLVEAYGDICINLTVDSRFLYPVTPDKVFENAIIYCAHWSKAKDYSDMSQVLEQLTDFDLRIYGDHWGKSPFKNYWYGFADYEMQRKLYSSALCAIHFYNPKDWFWGVIGTRPYEVLACGGILVSELLTENFTEYYISTHRKDFRDVICKLKNTPRKNLNLLDGNQFIANGNTYEDRARQFLELWGII